mgnify:FL=1
MKKVKKIIISLLVLLIILSIILIILIKQNNNIDENLLPNNELANTKVYASNSVKENNIYTILAIDNVIQNVIDYAKESNKQALYNITETNYIKRNNISTDNVITIYENIEKYYIQEMCAFETSTMSEYYTYGFILKENNDKTENYYFKVCKDSSNSTFSVSPLKIDEYNKAKEGKINKTENESIKSNLYNKYNYNLYSGKDVAEKYINDFIFKMKYIPDVAFGTLDEEYRNKKFSNIDEFKSYIKNNSERFDDFIIRSYGREATENITNYEVEDINNYYYKIKASSGMDYTIILDDYTVESNEYVQKYNSSSDSTKIATCINKFFKLIDSKEYKSAYAYLDDTFKQKNFDTVGKFETYAKQNFFNNNTVTISSAEKVGDIYSCKVQIKSGVSVAAMSKDITVIIKLKENTDFVMSFSINK